VYITGYPFKIDPTGAAAFCQITVLPSPPIGMFFLGATGLHIALRSFRPHGGCSVTAWTPGQVGSGWRLPRRRGP